jgi:hypothetical protein
MGNNVEDIHTKRKKIMLKQIKEIKSTQKFNFYGKKIIFQIKETNDAEFDFKMLFTIKELSKEGNIKELVFLTKIPTHSLNQVCDGIKNNKSLISLTLKENETSTALELLENCLSEHPTLKKFQLGCCIFDTNQMNSLSKIIEKNKSITLLNLTDFEQFYPYLYMNFYNALKKNETLQILYLSYYSSLNFDSIKNVIENHSSLRELYLSGFDFVLIQCKVLR